MPKYYVIPIDSEGIGYLGIKEGYNPYTHNPWFCGGCPQAFGGNDQGGVFNTLYNETLEESHSKIYLTRGVRYYRKVHEYANMIFFICTKFVYNPYNFVPQFIRQQNKAYWETTGEVLKVDMDNIPTVSRASAATHILQIYHRRTGRSPRNQNVADFLVSETVEAIRKAAERVQNNQSLPSFA